MLRIVTLFVGILTPVPVLAVRLTDYNWSCAGFLHCGSGTDAVSGLALSIIATVNAFIISLAILVFIYGALRMVISRGEEGKEAGKKALIYASLGLVFAMLTGAIIEFVNDYLFLLGG